MLNILSIMFTGLVVGVLARFFYPGAVEMGLIKTILLGVGGALVAGLFASWRSSSTFGEGVNRAGCLASVIGAMVLIFIGRSL
ncbi:GlsB/YeaQ/YmgE family stress response membrane protein [Novosphingobium sp.]|uniref:GlsB/YeaQ/YmgE family stress response membrane protein n=1 Tax=Novosphingobium sp. TaxID=1874826 RepID=UPI0026341344|nr:GlsB/YeaQ/YmgE family stress response membrane protein [Novosphingobium sp.]